MQLPPPLGPWRAWLTLFPPDLAAPVGELLLRLHPLVGSLRHAARSANDIPQGVGDIARRGQYERLLMSEWIYADAEPNEFLRRAVNNELLFTGPEPIAHRSARLSIAIFDAGSSQLGQARLAHMALFILLARRAEEAGAEFRWGILQQPGALFDRTEQSGMQQLLAARTLDQGSDVHIAWDTALEKDTVPDDCWFIGGLAGQAPSRASSRVSIAHDFATDRLQVKLAQPYSRRDVYLDLPPSETGVRLLREPFKAATIRGRIMHGNGRPSLKQPPRFSVNGQWLAVPQLNGDTIVFHVPQSVHAAPGKYRTYRSPQTGSILAAGIFKKSLCTIVAEEDKLAFHQFPGPKFSSQKQIAPRPPMEKFHAPVGIGRWLPLFFLHIRTGTKNYERVLALDIDKHLVAWERSDPVKAQMPPGFIEVASNVIGAQQLEQLVFYAVAESETIQLFSWNAIDAKPQKTLKVMAKGSRALFGNLRSWLVPQRHGLLAVQCSDDQWWWVGTSATSQMIEIADGATVIGVAVLQMEQKYEQGLVVLSRDKRSVQFRTNTSRRELIHASETIAQAAMDPLHNRIAWITQATRELFVRSLDGDRPVLQVASNGVTYAA